MNDRRKLMDSALKEIAVPVLREFGFRGTYPHFYRDRDGHIDLLTFQYRLAGGSFVVELSFADRDRGNIYIEKEAAASKLRVTQASRRLRLGASGPGSDHWFSFEPSGFFRRAPSYAKIADDVSHLLKSQGEPWWLSQGAVS